jgi:hypothetical protein
MKRTISLLAFVILGTVPGCLACCKPGPVPGPVEPGNDATCETACARLEALGCEAAKPTPGGEECASVCANAQASGIVKWDLGCRTEASTCDAADDCEG